jgi:hypothetical protein
MTGQAAVGQVIGAGQVAEQAATALRGASK